MSKFPQPGAPSAAVNESGSEATLSVKKLKNINLQVFVMLAAIAVIIVFFSVTTDGAYISARNVSNLLRQTAITGILAVGMVFVIISAEIDLSVGSMFALCVLAALVGMNVLGLPFPGGPHIDRAARSGSSVAIDFPRGLSSRRDLERLVFGERRQNPGQAPSKHRLARAGRAAEKHVVPAGCSNNHGIDGVVLADHLREIEQLRRLLRTLDTSHSLDARNGHIGTVPCSHLR